MTPGRILVLRTILMVVPALACAGPSLPPIGPAQIRAHVEFLADDLLEGRGTGSPGHEIAARYVASNFARAGLDPIERHSYLQRLSLVRYAVDPESAQLRFDDADGSGVPLVYGEEYVAVGRPDGEPISLAAEVSFLGRGLRSPALGLDSYEGIDVRGRIVLTLPNPPVGIPADVGSHVASVESREAAAASAGAAALIVLWTPANEALYPWTLLSHHIQEGHVFWAAPSADRPLDPAHTPGGVIFLRWEAAERLFTGHGHSLASLMERAATGESVPSFHLAAHMNLRLTQTTTPLTSPNVVGVLTGSDPRLKSQIVVATAHLDHVGVGEPVGGDSIYNGAIDNAAGVAALIEIAASVAVGTRPARTIVFLATTAEEAGLVGADFFLRRQPLDGTVVANVNMDGNHLLFRAKDLIAIGAEHSDIRLAVEAGAHLAGLEFDSTPRLDQSFLTRSDQYAFIKRGIPAIMLLNGFHSAEKVVDGPSTIAEWDRTVFHSPADEARDSLDYATGATYARAAAHIVLQLANSANRPRWQKGSFFSTLGRGRL